MSREQKMLELVGEYYTGKLAARRPVRPRGSIGILTPRSSSALNSSAS